jgi:hypothetical protein
MPAMAGWFRWLRWWWQHLLQCNALNVFIYQLAVDPRDVQITDRLYESRPAVDDPDYRTC